MPHTSGSVSDMVCTVGASSRKLRLRTLRDVYMCSKLFFEREQRGGPRLEVTSGGEAGTGKRCTVLLFCFSNHVVSSWVYLCLVIYIYITYMPLYHLNYIKMFKKRKVPRLGPGGANLLGHHRGCACVLRCGVGWVPAAGGEE